MNRVFLCLILIWGNLFALDKVIVSTGEWPPFTSESMDEYGQTSSYLLKALKSQNVEAEFKWFPWKRAYLHALHHNSVDVSIPWLKNEDREKDFFYSNPLVAVDTVFFHLKGQEIKWDEYNDLKDLHILGTAGYSYSQDIDKGIKEKFFFYDVGVSDEVNLRKLLNKRGHLFPCALQVCEYILKRQFSEEERARITYAPKVVSSVNYYAIVSKKHPNARDILSAINRGVLYVKIQDSAN